MTGLLFGVLALITPAGDVVYTGAQNGVQISPSENGLGVDDTVYTGPVNGAKLDAWEYAQAGKPYDPPKMVVLSPTVARRVRDKLPAAFDIPAAPETKRIPLVIR